MKYRLLYFVFFLIGVSIYGQQDYKGIVLDAETSIPVPFVNIGINEYGIGTVSDENGKFHLTFDLKPLPSDTIVFSSLGYKILEITVEDFPMAFNEYPKFMMKPQAIGLNEVVVTNKGKRFISDGIGYRNYGEENYGYWKDNVSLGAELATKIVAKKGLRRLEAFQFEIVHNVSDSLLIRINVYDDDGNLGFPGTNLNTSLNNIITTVRKKQRLVQVDLLPYDIYVNDDFVISLELLKVYGDTDVNLVLAASNDLYGSYRRYTSQGMWEFLSDKNMAYFLKTNFMVSEKMAQRFEKREVRKNINKRTVSGFTIRKGKMVVGVEVRNRRTKEIVYTNNKGRYAIGAKKNDDIMFSKEGFKTMILKVSDKSTENIKMKEE